MFDRNEDEEVRDTIWGDFNGTEDRILPYHKGSEYNTLLTFGDYCNTQRHEQSSTDLSTTEQKKSEAKNDFPGSNLESNPHFSTYEELSAPRFDMDPWPDFPSLNYALTKGNIVRNHQDSMTSKLINDFAKAPNLNPATDNMVAEFPHAGEVLYNMDPSLKKSCSFSTAGTMQLDSEPDIYGNEHGDKEGDSFLSYDWANIADFDDLDRIFRNNDSIFGHETIANADGLLSSSTDAISTTTPSFLVPDIQLNRDWPAEKGFVSFQGDDQSGEERKPVEEVKTAYNTVAVGEQRGCQSELTSENSGICYHYSNKVDRQKKLSKSRKKMEEKSWTTPPQNLSSSLTCSINRIQQFESFKMQDPIKSPSQSFPSASLCQQREVGGPGYMGFFHSSNKHMPTAYGHPTHPFPTVPLPSPGHAQRRQRQPVAASPTVYPDSLKHASSLLNLPEVQSRPLPMTTQEKRKKLLSPAHAERRQRQPVADSPTVYPDSLKHASSLLNLPEVQSRPLLMTTQEKIGKLRRRQQMHAMLAIQQQQQQFGQQSTFTDMPVSQLNQSQDATESSVKIDEATKWLSSSELNMQVEQEEQHRISMLIDDSLGETIFYQLQDDIRKLDISVRLCIRDSLFRLTRSAMERHNACDRSSINKSGGDENEVLANAKTNSRDRSPRSPAETDTNPIDRTVAHLLFHQPSETCARPVKDEIPMSPISCNLVSKQSNTCESMSEDKPENGEEMEV